MLVLAVILMTHFNTTFEDKGGQEISHFESDGSILKINLRGVDFSGTSFEYLEPSSEQLEKGKELFELNQDNELTSCKMLVSIPLRVRCNENLIETNLDLEIKIGDRDSPTTKKFSINLDETDFDIIDDQEKAMFFESLLISLQKKIPIDYKINSCLFCALSHYSVYGSDNYGTLICYKELKDKILFVKNKSDFLDLTDNKGFDVQETFYCSEFTEITSGLWLYKDTV